MGTFKSTGSYDHWISLGMVSSGEQFCIELCTSIISSFRVGSGDAKVIGGHLEISLSLRRHLCSLLRLMANVFLAHSPISL